MNETTNSVARSKDKIQENSEEREPDNNPNQTQYDAFTHPRFLRRARPPVERAGPALGGAGFIFLEAD